MWPFLCTSLYVFVWSLRLVLYGKEITHNNDKKREEEEERTTQGVASSLAVFLTFSSSFSTAAFSLKDLSSCACFSAPSCGKVTWRHHTVNYRLNRLREDKSQAAQAQGGLGSSCCITQDYKEMYGDFNDLGKSYDLIMKLEINVWFSEIVKIPIHFLIILGNATTRPQTPWA